MIFVGPHEAAKTTLANLLKAKYCSSRLASFDFVILRTIWVKLLILLRKDGGLTSRLQFLTALITIIYCNPIY